MYALIMLSAAAVATAQPLPTSDVFVGPIQSETPVVEASRTQDIADRDRGPSPVKLDLSDVSDGAQLKVKGAGLKLRMPL